MLFVVVCSTSEITFRFISYSLVAATLFDLMRTVFISPSFFCTTRFVRILVLIRCFALYVRITHDAPYWSHEDASYLRRCMCVRVSACDCVKLYVQFHGRTQIAISRMFGHCGLYFDYYGIAHDGALLCRQKHRTSRAFDMSLKLSGENFILLEIATID